MGYNTMGTSKLSNCYCQQHARVLTVSEAPYLQGEAIVLNGVLRLSNLLIQLLLSAALKASTAGLVVCKQPAWCAGKR